MSSREGRGDGEGEVVEAAVEELEGDIDHTVTDRMGISAHASPIGNDQCPQQLEKEDRQVLLLQPRGQLHDLVPDAFLLLVRDVDHLYYKSIHFIQSSEAGIVYCIELLMQANNLSRSSVTRKTSYFEKYRKQLQRISDEMRNKTHSSTSFSEKAQSVKDEPKTSSISQQKMPTTPTPLKTSTKRSPVLESQREPFKPVQSKEEAEQRIRQTEAMKEVQALMAEIEQAKQKLKKIQGELQSKRNMVETLKKDITQQSTHTNTVQIMNYAERILAIETRMKFKKEMHQDELNRLVNEKNLKHSQNVQLSKFIETLEEELTGLTQEYEKSEQQQSTPSLNDKTAKIENEINKLTHQCEQVDLKINNQQELKEISTKEFKRYAEVYKRQLIGKEIAQTEDRIKQRNNERRYLIEIERKRMLVKQKKIENGVRQKSIIQLGRVMDHMAKEMNILKAELATLNVEKKSYFKDEQIFLDK